MKHFIAIVGNIGAGKTAVSKKLAQHFDWELYQEPFQENPYLQDYYNDMTKWAFKCETFFLGRRLEDHINILNNKNSTIQDRCIYEGAEIFVKNLYLSGHLNETDWQNYNNLYQAIKKTITPPTLVVYVKSSTERCLKNINKRNRNVEFHMNSDYISNLNKLYEKWIENFDICPILIADGDNNEFKYSDQDFLALANQIQTVLTTE
ncbi:deoxynucleoside kinase [Candidatus Falkowbacteria bacterium]|jgi:deoxyadenosine/deoxycytidine kinase|nr:deoxynucleoside kinase [Candidatus Falkowbacteria bacterium]MBT5502927.1 deoxynucleoside kinase [Candidatus Falkowbacteria bacterium]MBT6574054.1 deoxynucleoside kinase [Candidatus Falkowbacteria bacterium]MBT7348623.1 deoxynucleoside kinase [Candidatus Falkowbacteria bacterium]MBT7500414.1 deoxynucleoside kinase [Candidatus Falkowbacteria bacterium]